MSIKTFTLEEANASLPQVEQLLDELVGLRDQIAAQSPAMEEMLARSSGNGGSKSASEYLLLLEKFRAAQELITGLGCEIKDLDQGLVDFPSYRDGVLVYLCWKRGEPRIEFWHTIESGFAGRKRL
jgi:hypothetical protein